MKKKEFLKQKLRELISSQPTLWKMLKKFFRQNMIPDRNLDLHKEIKSTKVGIKEGKYKTLFSLPLITLKLNDYLK